MADDHDEDDGPGCGTAEAETRLVVTYTDDRGVQFIDRTHCCYRHIPRPAEVLPPDAALIEVVIEDARARTLVRGGWATVTVGRETILIPAEL